MPWLNNYEAAWPLRTCMVMGPSVHGVDIISDLGMVSFVPYEFVLEQED